MERVDVAVVGGGPAGAAAGKAAAERGADVLVLEKGVPREDREGLGPDSTDAAGILDYWVELMGIDPADIPDGVILRELESAEFIGPNAHLKLRETGIASEYPHFGFTYDRAAFDDWLAERAEEAGADYRVGTGVAAVESDPSASSPHTLALKDGEEVEAEYLVLADGPQRTVTLPTLAQFLPAGRAEHALASTKANHIAYQEYRRFPAEAFEATNLKFWWGYMPGHTAYPWVFPNEDTVARVGLTMPIGMDLGAVRNRAAYKLLRPEDERIPTGRTYVERLLELAYGDRYDLEDFPLLDDRGKSAGTETYPISSTRPIDSPVGANVAVTGGAMGATSAFHEGGGHLAVRTGAIAGELAASGRLDRYNAEWKRAIGDEIRRNVAMADLVRGFEPEDWDRAFRIADRLQRLGAEGGITIMRGMSAAGWSGMKLAAGYRWHKYRYRDGRYVQIAEDEYGY